MKKHEFNDALSALIEYATVNGNEVSTETVHQYFDGILDNDDMYEAVYKYLTESKIKITDLTLGDIPSSDYASTDTDNSVSGCSEASHPHCMDELSEEEKMFLDMYMTDLEDIPEYSTEEKSLLIEKACHGDKNAFTRLTEAYLPLVLTIAEKYVNKGVKRNDIISDGNLGLIEGIMSYDFSNDFEAHITKCIENSMQLAIDEELGMHRIAEHAADRANAISDATTALAEKLGREATIEELCEYMALSEEEIREIMKMSLDAMTATPQE